MRIDVWSDIVCPFCLLGRRELEIALAGFDDDVEIVPRSFELDPTAAHVAEPVIDHLIEKYGITREQAEANNRQIAERAAGVGLEFNWSEAKSAPTLDAHRVVQLAGRSGLASEVESALMRAFFTEGRAVDDHDVIRDAAVGCGLDPARVDAVLASDEFTDEVRADEAEAHSIGVRGVPFFVFDGRFGVSGAQTAETFAQVLREVRDAADTPADDGPDGAACGPDGC